MPLGKQPPKKKRKQKWSTSLNFSNSGNSTTDTSYTSSPSDHQATNDMATHRTPPSKSQMVYQNNAQQSIHCSQQNSNPMSTSSNNHNQSTMAANTANIPIQWMNEIKDQLAFIHSKVAEIDNIKSSLNFISVKMSNIETDVKELRSRIDTVETGTQYLSNSVEGLTRDQTTMQRNVDSVYGEIAHMRRENEAIGACNVKIQSDLCDLQSRSMRNNLLFYGFDEEQFNADHYVHEDCSSKILHFCEEKLHIHNAKEKIIIDRAHRVGKRGNKARPIVVRFPLFKHREEIRFSSRALKGSQFGISEQFPKEIQEKRKVLIPIMKRARLDGKKANIVVDKLFIDNKEYRMT